MTLFILKIIGIVTMFIDHYYHIIGGSQMLNIIGRIAFPIFAFSLSEGFFYTRNFNKYLIRIGFFAVLMQIPLILMKMNYSLNIFFTLFTGIVCMKIIYIKINNILKLIFIGILCYITKKFEFDYNIYGILLILIFYIFRNNKLYIFISMIALNLLNFIFPNLFDLAKIQFFSIFSLIPIFLYNGKKGKDLKYFFYIFYPLHFLVIEIINFLLNK